MNKMDSAKMSNDALRVPGTTRVCIGDVERGVSEKAERGVNCNFWQLTRCQLQIITVLRQGYDAANLGWLSLFGEERNAVRSD